MWSTTTVVGSAVKKSHSSRQVHGLEIDHHMPAQRRDAAGDLHQLVLGREVHQPLDEVEAHAAHAGFVHVAAVRASVTLRLTVTTPLALPSECRSASSSALLSAPWQVACTITFFSKPRWSRSANSCSLLASHGVYLRSGANGKLLAGAEHMAMRIDAAGRHLEARLAGAGVPVEPAGRLFEFHGAGLDPA